MIYGSISRRYAKAIFDLGVEKNMLAQIVRQIESFYSIWSGSEELQKALTNLAVPARAKRAIVEKLAIRIQATEYVKRFLLLLTQRGRVEGIQLIYLTLKSMADRKEGIVRGEVASAFPLDPSAFSHIQTNLEKKIGKKVILTKRVEPELIGGIVIKIEEKVIDGSIRSYFEDIRKRIATGA